jgi:hypothetical protein
MSIPDQVKLFKHEHVNVDGLAVDTFSGQATQIRSFVINEDDDGQTHASVTLSQDLIKSVHTHALELEIVEIEPIGQAVHELPEM